MKRWPEPLVLTYHEVLAQGTSLSRYSVDSAQFASHMAFVRTSKQCPRVVFDDGDRSNFVFALPILEQYGIGGTFFVTAGFVGTRRQTMSWSELRKLTEAGQSVQAHGWTHRFLTQCSDRELRHELHDAKDLLEARLGTAVTELSFPGGRFNERVLEFAAEAGYQTAYTSLPWTRPGAHFPLDVRGRIMVRCTTQQSQLLALVRQSAITRGRIYSEHFLRTTIRTLVGDSSYHRLWRQFAHRATGSGRFSNALIDEQSATTLDPHWPARKEL